MPCSRWMVAVPVALALTAGGVAEAAIKTYSGVGHASMDGGQQACFEAAALNGRQAAVRSAVQDVAGGTFRPSRHGPLVQRAEEFVRKAKTSGKKVGADGRCEVSVKARIDLGRLERALNSLSGVIAVIVRYLVGGVVADDAGVNELEATNIAMRHLQDYGCRTVSLHEHYRVFSRQLKPQWQAVAGDGSARKEPETESDAEAIARIKRDLAERLSASGDDPMAGEDLELILMGEVDVSDAGRDPDSERFLANAQIAMSVHRLSTLEQYETTTLTLRGQGTNTASAANGALHAAILRAVADLNSQSETETTKSVCEKSLAG